MPYRDPEKHRAYAREAMRRHRAKPPKPVPEPYPWEIEDMHRHLSQPEAEQPDWVKAVITDIEATGKTDLRDEAQAIAAWKLFQPHQAEARRIDRRAKDAARAATREAEAREDAEHEAWLATEREKCSLCGEPPSPERIVVELGHRKVCEHCAAQVAAKAAAIRADDGTERETKRCSFCGKISTEVRLLMAGFLGSNICDQCVFRAVRFVEDNGVSREPASPARRKVKPARAAPAKAKMRKRKLSKAARRKTRRR